MMAHFNCLWSINFADRDASQLHHFGCLPAQSGDGAWRAHIAEIYSRTFSIAGAARNSSLAVFEGEERPRPAKKRQAGAGAGAVLNACKNGSVLVRFASWIHAPDMLAAERPGAFGAAIFLIAKPKNDGPR
jgi:hypothetical protein